MFKVLLDENLPVKIKYRLKDICEIYTVRDKNWNSLENGHLIAVMQKDKFDFRITSNKNLQYQQNLSKYSIGFIILMYRIIIMKRDPFNGKNKKTLQNKDKSKLIIIT